LLRRAGELGAHVREGTTVTALNCSHGPVARPGRDAPQRRGYSGDWRIETATGERFSARTLVGADGRNSTVARLCNLLPRPARGRVALQAHIPLPRNFGRRVVLQFLPEGYSGQAPVNETELNLCLVGTPPTISRLRRWAERYFEITSDQPWRTITPLTRSPVSCAHKNLFFLGDAARVVEPFTGEGIYYAIRSGELAAIAILKIIRGENQQATLREFARACAKLPSRFHRVRQQHRNSHRTDATGNRRDRACLFRYFVKCDITHEPVTTLACAVFYAIDANVDHDGTFAHVIGFHKFRSPNRCNNNVSRASNMREVAAARVHNRYGGVSVLVFLHEQQGQRFAYDQAATKNHNVRAVNFDFTFREQTLHAK